MYVYIWIFVFAFLALLNLFFKFGFCHEFVKFCYTTHILGIDAQNCEIELTIALTKIFPFSANGGSTPLNGGSGQKKEFHAFLTLLAF